MIIGRRISLPQEAGLWERHPRLDGLSGEGSPSHRLEKRIAENVAIILKEV